MLWSFKPMSSARQSDSAIREEILRATPLGSTEEEVDRYAKSRFEQDNFFHWAKRENDGPILMCLYGCYTEVRHFPFATCVRVSWRFSKDHLLTEVSVGRWVDSF